MPAPAPVATDAADFGVLLNLAYGAFVARLHAHLAEAGFDDLGPSFGYVFRGLADGPASLAAVAARLAITPQGALKIVGEMVTKGYVERRDDPSDGRVRLLALTARGRRALAAARQFHATFERALARELGDGPAAATRAALERIVAAAAADGIALSARPF